MDDGRQAGSEPQRAALYLRASTAMQTLSPALQDRLTPIKVLHFDLAMLKT